MMKTLAFATVSVAALVATTGIATADPKENAPVDKGATAVASSDAPRIDRRYCVIDTPTGTRIRQKVCKTRSEWLDQGFDPLNP